MLDGSPATRAPIRREERLAHDLDARILVWACWLGLSVAALIFLANFARNIPYMDEYDGFVPWLTHERPLTFAYFWGEANGHRIPLPKLLLFGLAKLTGADFRAGMYATVLLMSALSAGMIVTARRVRGYTHHADVVLPLLVLHWGHSESFLMGWVLAFGVATFLSGAALALIVSPQPWGVLRDDHLAVGPAISTGVCLVLLPLCGAQGTVLAAPLALWLAYLCVRSFRAGSGSGWRALAVLTLPLAACLVIAAYFLDRYHPAPNPPPCHDFWQILVTGGEFLLGGAGIGAQHCWPYGLVILALCFVAALYDLLFNWLNRRSERLPIAGIAAFLLGMAALAFVIGFSRGSIQGGFTSRYGLVSVPFILAVYLAALRWCAPARARLVQSGVVCLSLCVALANFSEGQAMGRTRREQYRSLMAALQSGKPLHDTAEQCGGAFHPLPSAVGHRLELMKKARIGPFSR
jgi:hypothetical protein